eukprot:m.342843 g.342843  ORF g.342843 m.342843 type:complete len:598 (+) comp21901_c0_seq1:181-1974(+)
MARIGDVNDKVEQWLPSFLWLERIFPSLDAFTLVKLALLCRYFKEMYEQYREHYNGKFTRQLVDVGYQPNETCTLSYKSLIKLLCLKRRNTLSCKTVPQRRLQSSRIKRGAISQPLVCAEKARVLFTLEPASYFASDLCVIAIDVEEDITYRIDSDSCNSFVEESMNFVCCKEIGENPFLIVTAKNNVWKYTLETSIKDGVTIRVLTEKKIFTFESSERILKACICGKTEQLLTLLMRKTFDIQVLDHTGKIFELKSTPKTGKCEWKLLAAFGNKISAVNDEEWVVWDIRSLSSPKIVFQYKLAIGDELVADRSCVSLAKGIMSLVYNGNKYYTVTRNENDQKGFSVKIMNLPSSVHYPSNVFVDEQGVCCQNPLYFDKNMELYHNSTEKEPKSAKLIASKIGASMLDVKIGETLVVGASEERKVLVYARRGFTRRVLLQLCCCSCQQDHGTRDTVFELGTLCLSEQHSRVYALMSEEFDEVSRVVVYWDYCKRTATTTTCLVNTHKKKLPTHSWVQQTTGNEQAHSKDSENKEQEELEEEEYDPRDKRSKASKEKALEILARQRTKQLLVAQRKAASKGRQANRGDDRSYKQSWGV